MKKFLIIGPISMKLHIQYTYLNICKNEFEEHFILDNFSICQPKNYFIFCKINDILRQ